MADSLDPDPKASHRGDGPQTVLQSGLSLWLQGTCHITGDRFHQRLAWPRLGTQAVLLEGGSEMKVCAGVSWVLLSAPSPTEGVKEAGWGRGRSWTVMQPQRSQPILRAARSRGWPYRVVPSWGKGMRPCTPHKAVILSRLLPGRGRTLGNSLEQRDCSVTGCQLSPLPAVGGEDASGLSGVHAPHHPPQHCGSGIIRTLTRDPGPKSWCSQEGGVRTPGHPISLLPDSAAAP